MDSLVDRQYRGCRLDMSHVRAPLRSTTGLPVHHSRRPLDVDLPQLHWGGEDLRRPLSRKCDVALGRRELRLRISGIARQDACGQCAERDQKK
jgi:hypothetical protein